MADDGTGNVVIAHGRIWSGIVFHDVGGQIIDLALQVPELSLRKLSVRFTDERKYFRLRGLGVSAVECA